MSEPHSSTSFNNLAVAELESIDASPASLLEQLPFELLLEIFKDYGRFELPISKTLLPFTRAPIFKKIMLKSAEDFKAFVSTVAKDSSCGPLVKSLSVELDDNPVPLTSAEELPFLVATTVIAMQRLNNVWLLSVDSEFLSCVLLSPLASLALPQLETLVLVDPFRGHINNWDVDHFIHLAHFSNLTSLRLESRVRLNSVDSATSSNILEEVSKLASRASEESKVLNLLNNSDGNTEADEVDEEVDVGDDKNIVDSAQSLDKSVYEESNNAHNCIGQVEGESDEEKSEEEESDEEESDEEESSDESDEMWGIQELDVCVNLDDSHILETILLFPITMLRISDSILGNGLVKLLEEVTFLCELHIYEDIVNYGINKSDSASYPGALTSIYPVITQFKFLQELTLSARVFSKELFQHLRDPLPLRCLTIGYMAQVRASDLKQLLIPDSPAHLSTLESLTLDVVWGVVADDRIADLGPYLDPEIGEFTPYNEAWAMPTWQSEFRKEDVEELLELGEKYGVEVDGNSVLAIEVEEEYEFEVELLNDMLEDMDAELRASNEEEDFDESEFEEEEGDSVEDDLD